MMSIWKSLLVYLCFFAVLSLCSGQLGDAECVITSSDACEFVAGELGREFVAGDDNSDGFAWGCYINAEGKATFDASGTTDQFATGQVLDGVSYERIFGDNSGDPLWGAAQNICQGLSFVGAYGCVIETWLECEKVAIDYGYRFVGNAGPGGDAWGCFINKNGDVRFDGGKDADGSIEFETPLILGATGRTRVYCAERIVDLEELWDIPDPTLDVTGLAVNVSYVLNSNIDVTQASYEVYDNQCVEGGVVLTTGFIKGDVTGGFEDATQVPVTVDINTITDPSVPESVYTEFVNEEGDSLIKIEYCVYFLIKSPDGSLDVNWVESIISVTYNLSADATISSGISKKERQQTETSKTYTVEAYRCVPGTGVPLGITPAVTQGELITICVRPGTDGVTDGLEMRSIDTFQWTRAAGANPEVQPEIIQEAIEAGAPASNYLSSYDSAACTGSSYCELNSILFASFFASPGDVSGSGLAKFQFSPIRRNLATGDNFPQRNLQDVPGSDFDLSITVSNGPGDNGYVLTAAGSMFRTSLSLAIGSLLAVAFLAP